MKRRYFIGGAFSSVIAAYALKDSIAGKLMEQTSNKKMPALFFGHGSPMNAMEKNSFTDFLSSSADLFPKPKAILVISAHWETRGSKVLKLAHPKTIHDFGGFPEALYKMQYPAPGSLATADRVVELLKAHDAQADTSWGLDHGTWTVLKYIYPHADIPVLRLSLNQNLSFREHLELAKSLKPLRDEGVLIMGSGNITHNLRALDFNSRPLDWAVEFDEMIRKAIVERDISTLTNRAGKEKLWAQAHPYPDHYLPLLYAIGVADEKEEAKFIYEGMQLGSLSMRSVMFT